MGDGFCTSDQLPNFEQLVIVFLDEAVPLPVW